MDLPELDPRFFSLIGLFLLIAVGKMWHWVRTWKVRVIAKSYDDDHHEETRHMVDEHEVKIAVHAEKHKSHEKRLDHVEKRAGAKE